MSKKVAVILSGCGFKDGSEIHESVLALLALDEAGAHYQIFAPNINQSQVINHISGESMSEVRNVMIESARIARGDIQDIKQANPKDFDAVIFPGGLGAVSNLSNFAEQGASCSVNEDVEHFVKAMSKAGKPAGFICIAPALAAKIYGDKVKLSIGHDPDKANILNEMGADHVECSVDNIAIDQDHNVVTTPAYMLGPGISDIAKGIKKLVDAVLSRI